MTAPLVAGLVAALAVLATVTGADDLRSGVRRRHVLRRLPRAGASPPGSAWFEQARHTVPRRLARLAGTQRADRALADWLDAAGRSVRAGGSLTQALARASTSVEASPLSDDAATLARRLDDGEPLVEVLAWFGDHPSSSRRLAANALSLAAEVGGAPAVALDGVAATMRHHLAMAGEARALSSQARLSALVIVVSPLVFAALGASADARVLAFLLGTPVGLGCLLLGVALDAVGALWMARLVRAQP
jgi:tight adherence protein B